jgi:hypothetical protein
MKTHEETYIYLSIETVLPISTMKVIAEGIYEGPLVDGKANGIGTWTERKEEVPNGKKYVGGFYDDKRHGKGTEFTPTGCIVFSGSFENDDMSEGVLYDEKDANGRKKFEGEFKKAQYSFAEPYRGTWFYADGSVAVTGKVRNNLFCQGQFGFLVLKELKRCSVSFNEFSAFDDTFRR